MPRFTALLLPLVLVTAASAAPWRVKTRAVALERASNTFRSIFEREFAANGWGKLKSAANTKTLVKRLDESIEGLRREADDRRPLKGRDRMIQAVVRGRAVEAAFRAHPEYAGTSRPRWGRLRTSINALAKTYDVRPIARR